MGLNVLFNSGTMASDACRVTESYLRPSHFFSLGVRTILCGKSPEWQVSGIPVGDLVGILANFDSRKVAESRRRDWLT